MYVLESVYGCRPCCCLVISGTCVQDPITVVAEYMPAILTVRFDEVMLL